jgi:hypothetical protein
MPPANVKRQRAEGKEPKVEPAPPVPEGHAAFSMVAAFERTMAASNLADLRDPQLQQWLSAVPQWVEWVLASTTASKVAAAAMAPLPSPQSTPGHSFARGMFPSSPSTSSPAAYVPRARVVDPSSSLLQVAGAMGTINWSRLPKGKPRTEAIGAAFEAACSSLLTAPGVSVVTVPAVEAAIRSITADDTAAMYLALAAAGLLPAEGDDADDAATATDASRLEAAAEGYGHRHFSPDVERVARIINVAATHQPRQVVEVLQRTVSSHFPPPRWPVLAHFETYVDLLLLLAGFPRPPKGFFIHAPAVGVGSSFTGRSPALSPKPTLAMIPPLGDEAPSLASAKASPATGVTASSPTTDQHAAPYAVADHSALLLDVVLTKLVAMDTALSHAPKDANCVNRLRRLVGRTAAILRKGLNEESEAGREAWLQALFVFHHGSVMMAADLKAVHMLVPLIVSACDTHHVSNFLHACISQAERLPACNVADKSTTTAHLAPLLTLLGPAFTKRGGTEGDVQQLAGIVRRMAKLVSKAKSKSSVAGNDRFADAMYACLRAVSEAFQCPAEGRGDISAELAEELTRRAGESVTAQVQRIATAVSSLYEGAMAAPHQYGDKVTAQLRRFRTTKCAIHFE